MKKLLMRAAWILSTPYEWWTDIKCAFNFHKPATIVFSYGSWNQCIHCGIRPEFAMPVIQKIRLGIATILTREPPADRERAAKHNKN